MGRVKRGMRRKDGGKKKRITEEGGIDGRKMEVNEDRVLQVVGKMRKVQNR